MPDSWRPMWLYALLLMCSSPFLVVTRQRVKSRLALWIDEAQVKTLTGYELEIKIISNGEVTPYVHKPELFDQMVIPPEIDTVNLTWQAGPDIFSYMFEDFISLDLDLLYQPLLGIPARGYIPRFPTVFQITIPCKGTERGVASLMLGLKIFDHLRRPLEGTPIHFRLKKQCVSFATSSLCTQACLNGGTCNPHGVCECLHGFHGPLCDIALCSPACQNNGTCISPSTCACLPGYYGNYCEKAVCGHVCQNGGQCLPEGFCWCSQGFYGDACEYSHCVPVCQNGGTCVGANRCQCSPLYSGHVCETKEDTDRPRRSKETALDKSLRGAARQTNQNVEIKLRKAEQRLLKITSRRSPAWDLPEEERRTLGRLKHKSDHEGLSVQERRYLVKFLTQQRGHLHSKDKTKIQRFKMLLRHTKTRRRHQPRHDTDAKDTTQIPTKTAKTRRRQQSRQSRHGTDSKDTTHTAKTRRRHRPRQSRHDTDRQDTTQTPTKTFKTRHKLQPKYGIDSSLDTAQTTKKTTETQHRQFSRQPTHVTDSTQDTTQTTKIRNRQPRHNTDSQDMTQTAIKIVKTRHKHGPRNDTDSQDMAQTSTKAINT